ncbi:MAG: HNH endonuclease domain-containing protein [Bacilli bacterium]
MNDVIYGNGAEIDHTIPQSISFDDSYNNKVLTKKSHHNEKSNMTSFQYLKAN